MKHLKTYEDFEQQPYQVGDIIKCKYNGSEYIAKIIKINSKKSYLVNLEKNHAFMPTEFEIILDDIIDMVKSIDEPASGTEWYTKSVTNPSNDMVLNNGIPDQPLPNTVGF